MAAARRDATYDEVMQERREAEYAARKAGKPELAETSSDSAVAEESADEKKKPFFLLVLAAMGPGRRKRHGWQRCGRHFDVFDGGRRFRVCDALGYPRDVRAVARCANDRCSHGRGNGKGFAALIRERFGIRLTAFAMCALLIGNVATTFSEFAVLHRAWGFSACLPG